MKINLDYLNAFFGNQQRNRCESYRKNHCGGYDSLFLKYTYDPCTNSVIVIVQCNRNNYNFFCHVAKKMFVLIWKISHFVYTNIFFWEYFLIFFLSNRSTPFLHSSLTYFVWYSWNRSFTLNLYFIGNFWNYVSIRWVFFTLFFQGDKNVKIKAENATVVGRQNVRL